MSALCDSKLLAIINKQIILLILRLRLVLTNTLNYKAGEDNYV